MLFLCFVKKKHSSHRSCTWPSLGVVLIWADFFFLWVPSKAPCCSFSGLHVSSGSHSQSCSLLLLLQSLSISGWLLLSGKLPGWLVFIFIPLLSTSVQCVKKNDPFPCLRLTSSDDLSSFLKCKNLAPLLMFLPENKNIFNITTEPKNNIAEDKEIKTRLQ